MTDEFIFNLLIQVRDTANSIIPLMKEYIRVKYSSLVASSKFREMWRKYPMPIYYYSFMVSTMRASERLTNVNEVELVYHTMGLSNVTFKHLLHRIDKKRYPLLRITITIVHHNVIFRDPISSVLKFEYLIKKRKRLKYNRPVTYRCVCGIPELFWQRFKRCKMCHKNEKRYCSIICYKSFHVCTGNDKKYLCSKCRCSTIDCCI